MRERVHLRVRGRVQGVFYRATAQKEAQKLGLTGWVRNEPDGTVEAVAEGPEDAVDRFLAWCAEGPPGAKVESLETLGRIPATGEFDDFSVSFTGRRLA